MSNVTERTNHRPATRLVTLVAAIAENGVIGQGKRLPWQFPADLAGSHENHEASFMMIPMQLSSSVRKMLKAAIFDRRQLAD